MSNAIKLSNVGAVATVPFPFCFVVGRDLVDGRFDVGANDIRPTMRECFKYPRCVNWMANIIRPYKIDVFCRGNPL